MKKKILWFTLAALLLIVGVAAYAMTAGEAKENTVRDKNAQEMDIQAEESAESAAEIAELSGEIKEIGDGYLLIADAVLGEVQVNLSDDTLFEGVEREELAAGQFVQVMYSGMMTRSLPPQITALKVGVYALAGEVTALEDGAMTIMREEFGDEVIVFLPSGAPEIAVGDQVIAYTNGAMTMSLPAQTTALGVVIR